MKETLPKAIQKPDDIQNLSIEEINKRFFNDVVSYVVRVYGASKEEAKDAAQFALIQMHKYLPKVTPGKEFAYLKKCAKNYFIRTKSSPHDKYEKSIETTDIKKELHSKISEEQEFITKDELNFLKKCVDKLPPRYQQVVKHYVYDDMTHEEVAKLLDIEVSTSRSQLTKAIRHLRKIYTEEGEL